MFFFIRQARGRRRRPRGRAPRESTTRARGSFDSRLSPRDPRAGSEPAASRRRAGAIRAPIGRVGTFSRKAARGVSAAPRDMRRFSCRTSACNVDGFFFPRGSCRAEASRVSAPNLRLTLFVRFPACRRRFVRCLNKQRVTRLRSSSRSPAPCPTPPPPTTRR